MYPLTVNVKGDQLKIITGQEWTSARHLFALRVVRADVGKFPADVEQHVVLPRRPFLHEIRGEHPGPEHDAIILKTAWKHTSKKVNTHHSSTRPVDNKLTAAGCQQEIEMCPSPLLPPCFPFKTKQRRKEGKEEQKGNKSHTEHMKLK